MKAISKALVLLSVILFISIPSFAGQKERDWQTGILRDSSRSRYFAGTIGNGTGPKRPISL